MNILEMFNTLDSIQPVEENFDQSTYEPTYTTHPPANMNLSEEFVGFKTRPVLYNIDGYISPCDTLNWGGGTRILGSLEEARYAPPISDKVDPNKIFNSDIAALRTLAADQQKITKMFEKKLIEGLTEKGKIGLNENDIMAMQALTAARGAVTSINKEQIAIKKNIADLRIKQQTASSSNNSNSNNNNVSGRGPTSMDVGRSILDSIFDAPNVPTTSMSVSPSNTEYMDASLNDVSKVLDELVPSACGEGTHIQYESSKPKTFVVVGDSDDDVEFVTYDESGEVISDYPNPTSKITEIDRVARTAVDELLVQYPIKIK